MSTRFVLFDSLCRCAGVIIMRRAAIATVLLSLTSPLAAQEMAGKILSVQGTVEVQQSPWEPAQVDQTLRPGAVIRTGARSRATILLADDTQIKIGPTSEMTLRQVRTSSNLLQRMGRVAAGTDQSIVSLNSGKAWLRTKKSPAAVEVKTPAVTAAIRGTELVMEVAVDGESVMTVVEGAVGLSNDFGSVTVNGGEQGRARVGEAPSKTVILNPEDAVQWTLYYSGAVSPRDYPFAHHSQERARAALAAADDPVERAQLLHDAGDLQAALQALQSVDSGEEAQVRGWILLELNRLSEAAEAFNEQSSLGSRGRLGLSLIHMRLNEFDRAYQQVADPGGDSRLKLQKATLSFIVGEVEEARRIIGTVGASDPVYPLVQGLLSNVELSRNDKDAALAAARRAVDVNPMSPSAHLSLSLAQQSQFDLEAAAQSAETALRLDPNFVQAQVQYATLLYGAGRSDRAETLARQALERAPMDSSVQSLLGFILLGRAKTSEAEVRFLRAISLDSSRGEPHLGLGIVRMREGRFEDAAVEMLTAATLEPRLSLYQSYLGKAFYEIREFEEAFAALDAASELDPRDPTPHLYSGIFQNDLNRPGQAVEDFQESIRLNDNRAVYRSRFVLDQDRATRNVQLAGAYNRLGLSEWANLEAVKSTLSDPSNHSARLFLGNTFLNLRGRTAAAGSELLAARLLLPVNSNSFNAFNDYTTLYERPRLNFSAAGGYGSFDSVTGQLVTSGGTSRFAFGSTLVYDRTAGFREPILNESKNYTAFNLFKFALTPDSDLLFSYSYLQGRSGDGSAAFVGNQSLPANPFPQEPDFIDEPFRFPEIDGIIPFLDTSDERDPNLRLHSRGQRFEAGYHKRFRPGSEVVVLFAAQSRDQVLDTITRRNALNNVPLGLTLNLLRVSSSVPNLNLQAAHYLKMGDFQARYGVDIYEGRTRHRTSLTLFDNCDNGFIFDCEPSFFEQEFDVTRKDIRFGSAFVQGDYIVSDRLTVTGGVDYSWANDDNVFIGPETAIDLAGTRGEDVSIRRWNPQGGVFFSPFESSTVRFAAARVLQPLVSGLSGGAFARERLLPSHLNGFPLTFNEIELARSDDYEVGWDQRIGEKIFLRVTGFFRDRTIPSGEFRQIDRFGRRFTFTEPTLFEGESFGGSAVWSQFLTDRLTIVGEYSLLDEDSQGLFRRDHQGRLSLFFVSSEGIFWRVQENYLSQDGRLGSEPAEVRAFTTDASVSYELPEKFGLLSFTVRNLFDRRYRFLADPLALEFRPPRRQLEFFLRFNF